jgi:hypothetical protein
MAWDRTSLIIAQALQRHEAWEKETPAANDRGERKTSSSFSPRAAGFRKSENRLDRLPVPGTVYGVVGREDKLHAGGLLAVN